MVKVQEIYPGTPERYKMTHTDRKTEAETKDYTSDKEGM
jgi:hypothetical protein